MAVQAGEKANEAAGAARRAVWAGANYPTTALPRNALRCFLFLLMRFWHSGLQKSKEFLYGHEPAYTNSMTPMHSSFHGTANP